MKIKCQFKSLQWSDGLVEYAHQKVVRLSKYELKPTTINVVFSAQRHEKVVEAFYVGSDAVYRAKAKSDDFYDSMDKVVEKIATQMAKRKSKVQHHKKFEKSHDGRLENMDAEFNESRKVS